MAITIFNSIYINGIDRSSLSVFFNCFANLDLISVEILSNGNSLGLHVSFDLIYCTWDLVFEFQAYIYNTIDKQLSRMQVMYVAKQDNETKAECESR